MSHRALAVTLGGGLPGLIYQRRVSVAGDVLDVSAGFAVDTIPGWFAYSQEVWPQATNGVLGYVCEGLAGSSSKHIAPHSFVDTCNILGP